MILSSLVAFLRPYFIQIVTAGVLILAAMSMILVYGHSRYRAGQEAERTRIEQQNQRFKNATDEARARVRECYASGGVHYDWDTEECQRP